LPRSLNFEGGDITQTHPLHVVIGHCHRRLSSRQGEGAQPTVHELRDDDAATTYRRVVFRRGF
jgi:hypothetical protein